MTKKCDQIREKPRSQKLNIISLIKRPIAGGRFLEAICSTVERSLALECPSAGTFMIPASHFISPARIAGR